jgi:hypothetical protein
MAGSLSLSASSTVKVYPCPNCKETINTSMAQCSFCSAVLDHDAGVAAAEAFSKLNQAYSDASYVKIMAGTALTFFMFRFIPLASIFGNFGFFFLELAIPVMGIRWWVKYGSIKTDEAAFPAVRRTTLLIGIGSVAFLIVVVAISSFLSYVYGN